MARKKRDKSLSAISREKIYLYERMEAGGATSRELVRLSLLFGMITSEQYADFLKIEKDCAKD
jgi:hypothetical protein